jgi:ATP-binding protein involved in chromosome partitioning
MSEPRKTERLADGGLAILWSDGHRATYSAKPLRLACRCAHCEDEWTGERRLAAASVPDDVKLLDVRPVGRYGLQLFWSDGHSTGIYTFDRLRAMCECEACRSRS